MYENLNETVRSSAKLYVEVFCDIMGYTDDGAKPETYFIGNDPFGIIAINDDNWKMTELYYVISEFDRWKEKYGDDLQKVIWQWYWYSFELAEKNYDNPENKVPITNLYHWLMGWRPYGMSSEEYTAQRKKELEESIKRRKDIEKELNKELENFNPNSQF